MLLKNYSKYPNFLRIKYLLKGIQVLSQITEQIRDAEISDILENSLQGKRPEYDDYIFQELFERLDLMQEYWSVIKMQKFVKELHNIEVPNETMRMRVKRAGYSYKSNRPSPYKGDKTKQEEFKKMDLKMWSKD